MAGVIKSKLEGLSPEVRAELDKIVAVAMNNETIIKIENDEPRVITDHLSALIELLTIEKKRAKAEDESHAAEDKEKAKAIAAENGAAVSKGIEVGDTVTFTMGSGKGKKTFTRTVLKKTDKTITVEFDEAYPCTTSATAPEGKKFIKFAQIVSFEKAVAVAAA